MRGRKLRQGWVLGLAWLGVVFFVGAQVGAVPTAPEADGLGAGSVAARAGSEAELEANEQPQAAVPGHPWVVGVGRAVVAEGDAPSARRSALAMALRDAVSQARGVGVRSDFVARQSERAGLGGEVGFESWVRDEVAAKARGFVATYAVLNEALKVPGAGAGDVVEVTVRAQVFASRAAAMRARLVARLQEEGDPRLGVWFGPKAGVDGDEGEGALAAAVAGLVRRGLSAAGFAVATLSQEGVAGDAERSGWASLLQRARQDNLRWLVVGKVRVVDHGVVDATAAGPLRSLRGQHRATAAGQLKILDVATGRTVLEEQARQLVLAPTLALAVRRASRPAGAVGASRRGRGGAVRRNRPLGVRLAEAAADGLGQIVLGTGSSAAVARWAQP